MFEYIQLIGCSCDWPD